MNWGYRILILYIVFVAGIVFMIYKANTFKIELEDKNYYAEELKFQEVLDATRNAKALSTKPEIRDTLGNLWLWLPAEFAQKAIEGKIRFIRFDDESKDRTIKVATSNRQQVIPKSPLASGMYKVELSWKSEDKEYYFEDTYTVLP